MASAGDRDRAEALARSNNDPHYQTEALARLAGSGSRCRGPRPRPGDGRQRRAACPVHHRPAPGRRETLASLAGAAADAGDLDRGEAIARSITNPYRQAEALASLAGAAADAGDLDRGEALARSITDPYQQARTLARVAAAAVDFDHAGALAASVEQVIRSMSNSATSWPRPASLASVVEPLPEADCT